MARKEGSEGVQLRRGGSEARERKEGDNRLSPGSKQEKIASVRSVAIFFIHVMQFNAGVNTIAQILRLAVKARKHIKGGHALECDARSCQRRCGQAQKKDTQRQVHDE